MTTRGHLVLYILSLGILEEISYYMQFEIYWTENFFQCSMSRMLSIILLAHLVNKSPFCLSPSHVPLLLSMECFYASLLCWSYAYFLFLKTDHFHFNPTSFKGAVLYIGINRLNCLLVSKKLQFYLCSCLVLYVLTDFHVRRLLYLYKWTLLVA